MTASRDEDSVNRINSIRAELEAQRKRILELCQFGADESSGLSSTGIGRNLARQGNGFPRSVIMRVMVEHPDWLAWIACILIPRLRILRGLDRKSALTSLRAAAKTISQRPTKRTGSVEGSSVNGNT